MFRMVLVLLASVLFIFTTSGIALCRELPTIILWPDGVPEPRVPAEPAEESVRGADGLTRRFNVSQPRLLVHLPAETVSRTGAAAIVIPGGGFGRLADEHEGADACRWLTRQGIVAFQLVHRTPTSKHTDPSQGPVQDAQQAVLEVRRRAEEFEIKPDRIAVMGFSAGGQVALIAASGPRAVPANRSVPEESAFSVRPDLLLLIYPYRIFDPERGQLRPDIDPAVGLPPTFIAQMGDDKASLPQGSAFLYMELVKQGVPAELHIYERGGHGFGMRQREGAPGTTDWSIRAEQWLLLHGYGSRPSN